MNWPGGGGGSTMLYYDQGMFEEVNYQTSAIPAEVMTGGIYLNMVTKSGSNRWRGDMKTFYAHRTWQSENFDDAIAAGLPGGIPITKLYDFNLAGGGPLVRNRLWVNGAYRNWRVDKLTLARNPDGSRAIDDNLIWNTSGKGIWQASSDQKLGVSWNYNWKERFHRRDTPPNFAEDRASLWQTNPAASTQIKYTLARRKLVFDSTFGIMDGVTNYYYQPGHARHRHPRRGHRPQRSVRRRGAARGSAELSRPVRQRRVVHDARPGAATISSRSARSSRRWA